MDSKVLLICLPMWLGGTQAKEAISPSKTFVAKDTWYRTELG